MLPVMPLELTPREKRIWFVRCLATLISWADSQGLELALDEGPIETPRRVWVEPDGSGVYADAKYPGRSFHYRALAVDLFLYRDGELITDQTHASWKLIAEKWETLHPLATSGARGLTESPAADRLCRAGIRHVSFDEATKVYPLPWQR